jgi:hypothetical protein
MGAAARASSVELHAVAGAGRQNTVSSFSVSDIGRPWMARPEHPQRELVKQALTTPLEPARDRQRQPLGERGVDPAWAAAGVLRVAEK